MLAARSAMAAPTLIFPTPPNPWSNTCCVSSLESENLLSQWPVLGLADNQGATYGGFFGYNTQWDDVVIGLDVNLNRSNFFANAPADPIQRAVGAGGNSYLVTVDGSGSMRIDAFGSARMRGGYVLDNFLPYATFGFAFGQADVARSATVFGMQNPTSPPNPATCGTAAAPNCLNFLFTSNQAKTNTYIFGWSVGGGLDMLVWSNVFVRAEYEYLSFAGVSGIKASINSARVGAGFKF
jgi:outer membrane immunogenic protein